jgi:accessory gene regulator protein AgrB
MDYIFYRAYMAYEKKKEPGLFGATAYCSVVCLCLFMPIFGLVDFFLKSELSFRKTAVILYIIGVFIAVFLRYHRKSKLRQVIEKYRGSGYNKKIPTWLIFCVLPLSMILGVWCCALIG